MSTFRVQYERDDIETRKVTYTVTADVMAPSLEEAFALIMSNEWYQEVEEVDLRPTGDWDLLETEEVGPARDVRASEEAKSVLAFARTCPGWDEAEQMGFAPDDIDIDGWIQDQGFTVEADSSNYESAVYASRDKGLVFDLHSSGEFYVHDISELIPCIRQFWERLQDRAADVDDYEEVAK